MSTSERATSPPVTGPAHSAPRSATPADPYRSFGIVGFALSFFAVLNVAGLIISIIALVKSRRAGFRNRFALAGIVISGAGVLIALILIISMVSVLVGTAQMCAQLGDGVHTVGTATYTCSPTSFYVSYDS